jgi:integrase
MPEERWLDLFKAMRSNRDRAILALAVSNAARAAELLGIRGGDLDWGDQLVRVRRKGSGAEQWLPGSADGFVWLRLYLDEIGGVSADEPVWWTLRRRDHGAGLKRQPVTYDAFRAVLRRANALLGTNWSMHDLRHSCALRMVSCRHNVHLIVEHRPVPAARRHLHPKRPQPPTSASLE